jgi:hypothetical protein
VYINTSNLYRYATGTNVIVCGCSAEISPASIFPPRETPDECLASSTSGFLEKRVVAFSRVIGTYEYTCNLDSNNNPLQDCLNTMAKICHPEYMGTNKTLIRDCKIAVNSMTRKMSPWWKKVRIACGQWAWTDGTIGSLTSSSCDGANLALQTNAYYSARGESVSIPSSLADSINFRLWSMHTLNE